LTPEESRQPDIVESGDSEGRESSGGSEQGSIDQGLGGEGRSTEVGARASAMEGPNGAERSPGAGALEPTERSPGAGMDRGGRSQRGGSGAEEATTELAEHVNAQVLI